MISESILNVSLNDHVKTSLLFLGTYLTFLVHLVVMMYPYGQSYKVHPQIEPGYLYIQLVQMWEYAPNGGVKFLVKHNGG